jgi:hypothetical protein
MNDRVTFSRGMPSDIFEMADWNYPRRFSQKKTTLENPFKRGDSAKPGMSWWD